MKISDNYTDYGLHRDAGKYFWCSYQTAVLISSIMGNSIILVASTRYNALRLNKCIVAVLQHIAVCDLVACFGYVLPTLISLIANQWVLGDVIAHIHLYLDYFSSQVNSFLTVFLAFSKMLILKYPLRTKAWTKKRAHILCASIWIFANIYPILRFILDKNGLVFSYISYNINFGLSSNSPIAERIVAYSFTVITKDILTLIILIASFVTLLCLMKSRKVAKRSGGTVRWQGVATVIATVSVYTTTVILDRVGYYIAITVKSRHSQESDFNRISEFLKTINIISNFYIYCITLPSFRKFVKMTVVKIFTNIRQFMLNETVVVQGVVESYEEDTL